MHAVGPATSCGATRADEPFTPQELIGEPYRGIRPAPGYPAQPDHTEKVDDLRAARRRAPDRVGLTESYAMWPGSSVSGLYLAHPNAKYFAVGRLQLDQIESYAERKGSRFEQPNASSAARSPTHPPSHHGVQRS